MWPRFGAPHAALVLASGPTLEPLLDLVVRGGRIAYPNGVEPPPRSRNTARVVAYDGEVGAKELSQLGRAVKEAKLEVPLAGVYPLAQTAQAHKRIEKGHLLGRVVLRIRC